MIQNYQQRRQLETPAPPVQMMATVSDINRDGALLLFNDGTISKKRYRLNGGYEFEAGDRVVVSKKSGTYIIEYPLK